MIRRDLQDVAVGAVLAGVGVFVALYAGSNYKIGTVSAMGPGFFPLALGILLAVLGVVVLVEGFIASRPFAEVEWAPLASVLAGLLAFALLIERVGMVPSIVATVLVSTLGPRSMGIGGAAILSVVLSVLAYAVFTLGLNLQINAFQWRF